MSPSAGIMAANHLAYASGCADVYSDGFDVEPISFPTAPWIYSTGSYPNTTAGTSLGRTGYGVNVQASGGIYRAIPIPNQSDYITLGFAFYSNGITSTNCALAELRRTGVTEVRISQNTTAISFFSSTGTLQATSATGLIAANTWYYLEVQFYGAAAGSGWIKMRLNGVEIMNVTGKATRINGTPDEFRLMSNGTVNHVFDDFYITTGSTCTFKGDQTIGSTIPVTATDIWAEPFDAPLAAWSGSQTSVAGGRTGNAMSLGSTTTRMTIDYQRKSRFNTVGLAVKIPSLTAAVPIMALQATDSTYQCSLRIESDGSLSFLRGYSGGAVLVASSAPGLITAGTWYYIELQVVIDALFGSAIVRIDGTTVLNLTNVNTKGGTVNLDPSAGQIVLVGMTGNTLFDDLYWSVGSGCVFKGPQSVVGYPTAPTNTDLILEPFNNFNYWSLSNYVLSGIGPGRTGTCAKISGTGGGTEFVYIFPPSLGSIFLVIGFAYRVSDITASRNILNLRNVGSSINLSTFRVNVDGSLQHAGSGTTAPGLITTNTWYYLELKVRMANAGSQEIRVNGTTVLGPASADTNPGVVDGTPYGQVALLGASGVTSEFDDLYLSIGSAADFKGVLSLT